MSDFSLLPNLLTLKQHPEVQIKKSIFLDVYTQLQDFLDSEYIPHLLAFHELAAAVHDLEHVAPSPSDNPADPVNVLKSLELVEGVDQHSKLVITDTVRWIVFASTYRSEGSFNLRSLSDVIDIPSCS